LSYHGYAIDLNVEGSGPGGYVDKNSGGWCTSEVARINRIHRGKVLNGSAIHGALQDLVQVRAGRFEAESHLIHDKLRLLLDRYFRDLTGFGIERWEPRDVHLSPLRVTAEVGAFQRSR
jgi:hypothetical protein